MNRNIILSKLPSVDEILKNEKIINLTEKVPRDIIVNNIRVSLQSYRNDILKMKEGQDINFEIDIEGLIGKIIKASEDFLEMNLKTLVNATGVVLHTNLGRSLLSEDIQDRVWSIASSYSNLEFELKTGRRGLRYNHVVDTVKFLTGAEDALVVNNNAAAVLLVLSSMAKGKEVIVSRGQLVEIGGSFRIPEVMEESGAQLIEVGTTNKTHIMDYKKAIGEETGALLKVHTSNYKILGFTQEVDLKELVSLGHNFGIPIIEDLGSGILVDLRKFGLNYEPTVQQSIAMGADIVTFSGDKLLGGPQAGIIVGKKKWINIMKENPLTRALRIDKLTLAALEATLKLYLDEKTMFKKVPTLRMLTENIGSISNRAESLYKILKRDNPGYNIQIREDYSQVGGGSLPLEKLPTKTIVISHRQISTSTIERKLRTYTTPIITRVQAGEIIIDMRTLREKDYTVINEALCNITMKKGEV